MAYVGTVLSEESHSAAHAHNVEAPPLSCRIPAGVNATCEMCVSKGAHCFWCEKTKNCSDYMWHFPNCPLDGVRYKNCWVNWSALTITLGVLGGIILAIICCCCCYCCYRCKRCRRRWVQRAFERRYAKEMAQRLAMENKQEQRRMERKAQIDEIRIKYGT
ncbi:unnamed protein product [Toxocara canis]|uniref:Pituitary tumor-transforming gene 1 protein-interacting protein n=1 Tax=Toxocara canis TaxID=6265 RepID=A0A183UF91_TOXCA|nr:unnamed protein product [Toxocara canis]